MNYALKAHLETFVLIKEKIGEGGGGKPGIGRAPLLYNTDFWSF